MALDPDYGLAWAGLADGRSTLGLYGMVAPHETMPEARAAATRAVQLDDSAAESHCALAVTALMHDFDVATARREFRRAMELNSHYPQAVALFSAFVLAYIDGKFDEAVALMAPIVEHDPSSAFNRAQQSILLAAGGRCDEGVPEALAAVALDPESLFAHWGLQINYTLGGRYAEAVSAGKAAQAVSGRHPWSMQVMGEAYSAWGKHTEAQALHGELMKRAESEWVSPAIRACSAASAGLPDDVLILMASAVEHRDPFLMLSMGTFPLTQRLRRVLREAGTLDDVRRQIGLLSHD